MLGQLFRFGISGIVNTVIDFGIFNFLVYISGVHSGILLALINTTAVSIAAVNSYFLNRSWTFNSLERSKSQFIRFFLATAVGILINSMVVIGAGSLTGLTAVSYYAVLNGGKLAAAVLSASWNFFSYRHWVFPATHKAFPYMYQDYTRDLVSVIIPAYNESKRLPPRLQNLADVLPTLFPVEILVVDDGSRDDTLTAVQEMADKYPVIKCLSYVPNCGKGKAVQTGILASRGQFLIYTDADDTFTVEHIKAVVDELQSGRDMVIACRRTTGHRRLQGESHLRTAMGRVFNYLVQLFLLPGIIDTQCGLKGFQRTAACKLFPRQIIQRFAFDVELLVLARSQGLEVAELPVAALDCTGSQVNCWLSPLQMCWDLLKVKTYLLTNRYGLPGGNQPMLQFIIVGSLFTAALAVRIPWLWEVPRFIDELKEVQLAYQIYSGEVYPLHNMAHDIGSLHNYILAGWFKLLGPSIYWPRLYVAVTAALTVVLVYQLARRMYGPTAALLSAGLLLTNGMHILVTHMAWSNCTTPFFFTLALIAALAAEQKKSGWWLIVSGLLWAIALQTHSSVIIFVLITLVYVLRPAFRQKTGITLRFYILSAAAFIAGYANMIYYNIVTLGGSLRWLAFKSYALETDPGINSYLSNLARLLVELLRSLSSTYTSYDYLPQYFLHPAILLLAILLGSGIYCTCKSKSQLLVWLLLGGILIIPIVNERYAFYISTRYIMPLLILSILLSSIGAVQLFEYVKKHFLPSNLNPALAAAVLLLVMLQLYPFYKYCSSVADTNASNRMALSIVNLAGEFSYNGQTTIVIDDKLELENEPLPYLFTLRQQPFELLDTEQDLPKGWINCLQTCPTKELIAVMNENTFEELKGWLAPTNVSCLSSRIVIPTPSSTERRVYVVFMKRE